MSLLYNQTISDPKIHPHLPCDTGTVNSDTDDSDTTDDGAEDNEDNEAFCAARNGDVKLVKSCLERTLVDINDQNANGETLLTIAIRFRHNALVKVLLAHEDTNFNRVTSNCQSPLCAALEWGNYEAINLLLEHSAAVDQIGLRRRSPLSFAAEFNELDIATHLLKHSGISVDLKDVNGRTPLSWAATPTMAQLLLDHGADINSIDNEGRSADNWARAKRDRALIEFYDGKKNLAKKKLKNLTKKKQGLLYRVSKSGNIRP